MALKDPELEAAQDELVDCMRMLWRLPDRERSYLYHSYLRWPAMVRDQGDYPDQGEPRPSLSVREIKRMERMFDGPDCYMVRAIDRRDRRLVGAVAALRARDGGSFGWDDVWRVLGYQLVERYESDDQNTDDRPVMKTYQARSDAHRKRYKVALVKLAAAMKADRAAAAE